MNECIYLFLSRAWFRGTAADGTSLLLYNRGGPRREFMRYYDAASLSGSHLRLFRRPNHRKFPLLGITTSATNNRAKNRHLDGTKRPSKSVTSVPSEQHAGGAAPAAAWPFSTHRCKGNKLAKACRDVELHTKSPGPMLPPPPNMM